MGCNWLIILPVWFARTSFFIDHFVRFSFVNTMAEADRKPRAPEPPFFLTDLQPLAKDPGRRSGLGAR